MGTDAGHRWMGTELILSIMVQLFTRALNLPDLHQFLLNYLYKADNHGLNTDRRRYTPLWKPIESCDLDWRNTLLSCLALASLSNPTLLGKKRYK